MGPWIRRICLPSSNGCFTARAVGRIFGALANGGSVVSPFANQKPTLSSVQRLCEASIIERLQGMVNNTSPLPNTHPDSDDAQRARMSCGYFPWASPELHGKAGWNGTVLNHEGMGGCMVYADPQTGLAICIFKNVYEPLSGLGG